MRVLASAQARTARIVRCDVWGRGHGVAVCWLPGGIVMVDSWIRGGWFRYDIFL
jgi:hypothetical protein